MITSYHAECLTHEVTKRYPSDSAVKPTGTLVDAQAGLNPHQIDAALFTIRSRESLLIVRDREVKRGSPLVGKQQGTHGTA